MLGELDVEQGVRLLGVGLSRLGLPGPQQLTLAGVEDNDSGWGKLSAAMDGIRQRYGHSAIRPGFPKPQTEDNG